MIKKIIIDVRNKAEFEQHHLPKSINIPVEFIYQQIQSVIPIKNTEIIVYCASGSRSKLAKVLLERLGYTNVTDGGAITDLINN